MKVLVTGAGGSIGRALGRGLPDLGHDLRGLDLTPAAVAGYEHDWVVGDCLDAATVDAAVRGVDAVVHLAGNPDEDSLPDALASHAHTTAHLLEAMVRHDVRRIAYASSNHAVGRTPHDAPLTTSVRPRPDTFYGVAKVAGEALLSLYVDRYDIGAVAMRIGTFADAPETVRQLSTWLSPADTVRMVDAAITHPDPGYTVVNGISANTRGWWDLEPGRAIGFDPQDDAERHADSIVARPEDDVEDAFVGGPHVTSAYVRSAF
ncbi:NAD(P)-dependent oxidoreductase [Aeromicrobium sp. CFBP 8757]|uniref:NAD-dependent epimerase/dehydratase family protein n=1 Tax=Aeromicrobium sp. CFBP 8757 TaxID=2775288 RepID=UPI00177FD80C|nr:NAD(P)-dependent oxidoreductase [Aeromicrobium sp. CFBP 8757]MBD8605235.1 NAD(P)-dependent oxidoreductase [Aeromicrobium sp. CFBP 8757]